MAYSLHFRRPVGDENSSYQYSNLHNTNGFQKTAPAIRPSYNFASPVYRRNLPSTSQPLEFPGSPDFFLSPAEPLPPPPSASVRQQNQPHLPPAMPTRPRPAAMPATATSLVFPGSPEPVVGNFARFPARNFQVYQEVEPQRHFVQPPPPVQPVRVRAPPAPVAPVSVARPAVLERQPSVLDELRARAAASRKFQPQEEEQPPAISEQARVFGAIRRQYEDISDQPDFPSTPQLPARDEEEEISARPFVPQSAPIHRRSLTNLSPAISDFPVLSFDDVQLPPSSPSEASASPRPRVRPEAKSSRKHRNFGASETRSSRTVAPKRGRGRPRQSVSSDDRKSRPKASEARGPSKQTKLTNFRQAIRGQEISDSARPEEGVLAVAAPARKPRTRQPRERKEISVSLSEIPGLESVAQSGGGSGRSQRKRVPRCRWFEGQRYVYARDGTLLGMAGMVDETQPELAPSVFRFNGKRSKGGRRSRQQQKQQEQQQRQAKPKKKATTTEGVVELGERRRFEFREDERGVVWAKAEGSEEESQILVPAGASELIEGVAVSGETTETSQLRKGISDSVFTTIEFQLEAGGIKEPEKIQTPGSLRGVVMACGDGNCVQVKVGEESKMVGVGGSFMVESETEWMVHNKHKSAKAVILVILISDFRDPSN